MKAQIYRLSLVIVTIFASLIPMSVGAQTNTYTSIIMTDVLSGDPIVGGAFTTDLQVSITNSATPEVGIEGVEIWMPFNANAVTVDDCDDNPANGIQVQVKNGFFDGSLAIGANDVYIGTGSMPATAPPDCFDFANPGCIHVAASHTDGSGPVTSKTGTVATITWGGVADGATGIGIAVEGTGDPPGSVLSNSDGQPIPINSISVPDITIVKAGTINGIVWRQGAQTGHANTEVTAVATGEGVIATTKTAGDGTFISPLQVPAGGDYVVNAHYAGYLQSQKSSIHVVGAAVDIGATKLVGGDVNGDNCINILDIVSIIGVFDTTSWPANEPKDINDDGTVNILDLTLAAGNFTRCGPTTWAY